MIVMKKYIIILLVVLTSCCIEPDLQGSTIKIMSWNVQNLFDGKDDGEEYSDYSVKDGKWSSELYSKRLSLISGIIAISNPDIIALQEIEGVSVLKDLSDKYLNNYKYIISTESESAIEVGFLSRYPIVKSGVIGVGNPLDGLRDILEITVDINGTELILFNNHWKSKSGGGGNSLRVKSANTLKKRIKQLEGKEFIIMGDLNENFNEYQRVNKSYKTALLLENEGEGISITTSKSSQKGYLYTPWKGVKPEGSYIYRGNWESIDHFLLSPELLDNEGFAFRRFAVDNRDSLFLQSNKLNSWKTYLAGGYSDHLPIILILEMEGGVKKSID